jgi:tripartite-type tricarboxylate transporter receptor subunit TctC
MRIALVAILLLVSLCAYAATAYPDKPIRLIVPVAPGGGADITARAVAQKLAAAWGQQIIIDNRAGAGGTVGMEIGARATPDGYTLIEGSMGPLTVDMSLYSKLPYDSVRDFTPIARGVTALNMLVVHPSLPVNSVKELIAYAKSNPAQAQLRLVGRGPRRSPRRRNVQHARRREDAARAVQGRCARDGRSRRR